MKNPLKDHINNRFALLIDESSSMYDHQAAVVDLVDGMVAGWAEESVRMKQTTLLTVYTFASSVECLVWDLDVLRFPSIAKLYQPCGNTALIAAIRTAIRDIREIPTRYGNNAVLAQVITDGCENWSYRLPNMNTSRGSAHTAMDLRQDIARIPDSWTLGALVPDQNAVRVFQSWGFPEGNITKWNPDDTYGVEEAARTMTVASSGYMATRAAGGTGTRTLYTGDASVNAESVKKSGAAYLDPSTYMISTVTKDKTPIREWVEQLGVTYVAGLGFYELTKPENIQPQKSLIVMEKLPGGKLGKAYSGPEVRVLLELPKDEEVRVKPEYNSAWRIFVESTSTNRHLRAGQKFLYRK